MFNDKQLQTLNNPLSSNRIKTRSKGNIQLSYIEGHDVIEAANHIFGFGQWDYAISKLEQVSQEVNHNQNNVICYKAQVQVLIHNETHSQDVSREDVGFGSGIAKTLADAHEGEAKEAVTDALKRTLRSFGNQFGLSLYDKSRNHTQANNHQAPQIQSPANNMNQQQYNQPQQNQPPNTQAAYQHQQDFSQLTNLGLAVMQQGENLIVVGDNVFANKEIIKQNGFRWDGQSKSWYMPLRKAA